MPCGGSWILHPQASAISHSPQSLPVVGPPLSISMTHARLTGPSGSRGGMAFWHVSTGVSLKIDMAFVRV